jgi:hypothetical protein
MYVPSHHFEEEPEVEIVCLFTNERYVYMEGGEKTIIDPKYHEGSIEALPSRFFKMPFIIRQPNGSVRVFGGID